MLIITFYCDCNCDQHNVKIPTKNDQKAHVCLWLVLFQPFILPILTLSQPYYTLFWLDVKFAHFLYNSGIMTVFHIFGECVPK